MTTYYDIPANMLISALADKLADSKDIVAPDWSEYVNETKEFLDQLEASNIVRINSEKYFCNETENGFCYASSDTEIFYTDSNHLTFEGITFLTKELEKTILTKVNND